MDDTAPRRSRLRGWWGVGAAMLLVLVIFLMLVWWWYQSTADLVAVRADAKARGIPSTWAESGQTLSPPDQTTAMERIFALSSSFEDYEGKALLSKVTPKPPQLKPFLPIPQEAYDHHASMNQALLAEMLALIDALPSKPVVMSGERTVNTPLPGIAHGRRVIRVLGERILLAPSEQLPAEVRRCLHFIQVQEQRSVLELLVVGSLLASVSERITGRLVDLKTGMPDLAEVLDQMADRQEDALITALMGDFLIANYSVDHLEEVRASMGSSTTTWDHLTLGVMMRASREPYLRRMITWIELARRRPPPSDLVLEATRIREQHEKMRSWIPDETLSRMFMQALATIMQAHVTVQLRLRVLAAELRGDPLPIDPFDPSGRHLRRIEREGQVMGAYTVYENGTDEGGKNGDKYFPLYGPLNPPVTSNP